MYNPDKLRHLVLACLAIMVGAMICATTYADETNTPKAQLQPDASAATHRHT